MNTEQLVARAVAPVLEIIDDITPDRLASPTPCTEFDVARLVRHLLFWGPALEASARKEVVTTQGAETDVDLTDWQARLGAQLRDTASAWGTGEAWEGMTSLGSPQQMPAEVIGGMTVGEMVVHGWDLATGVGRELVWDDEVLTFVHQDLLNSAEMGREMGLFGPEVPVPTHAPLLDRLLGLTGRKP